MSQDQGASARADRATRASPEPASGLGQKASVPCAFTPGPWSLKIHTGNGKTIGPKDDWSVRSPDGLGICFEGQTNPNADADAHLIAAAPELYQALGICVAMAERALKASMNLQGMSPYDIAMAALAKARGQ